MKKYWTLVIFILFVGCILLAILDTSNIDQKLSSEIHRYKDARKELLFALSDLENYKLGNLIIEGVDVKFTISKKQAEENQLDTLVALYNDGLIQELIITQSNEILFSLKTCDNLECDKLNTEHTSSYLHFLSKNRVNFMNENGVEVVERENVEEWTYCIVKSHD